MKLFSKIIVEDFEVNMSMADDGTLYNTGPLVGTLQGNSLDDFYIDQVGGKIHVEAPTVSNVGLIGRTSFTGSARVYMTNWYSEITFNPVTIVSNLGAVSGGTSGLGLYQLDMGWAAINYPAGMDEANNINPIIGYNGSYTTNQAGTVIDTDKFPCTDPWNEFIMSTTAAMLSGEPFTAFDFDIIWSQVAGVDYPRLIWAAGEPVPYVFWVFHTPRPTPVTPENEITEFRAGKIMNYRVYDLTDPDVPVDITGAAKVTFLPIPDAEVDPLWQVYADPDIMYVQVVDSGTLPIQIEYNGKTAINKFDIYGPDYFTMEGKFTESIMKNVAAKGKVFAHYKDDYKEPLIPLTDFLSSPDDKIKVNEASIQGLEVGTQKLQIKRFQLKELVDIEVIPLQVPGLVDVLNTSATLYVFFELTTKMDVDTYFSVRAFEDADRTKLINGVNTRDNVDNFTVTINGGGSWQPIPQSALSPSGEASEMYCAKLFVGPKEKVYLDLGINTGEETEDIYAPLIAADPPPGTYNRPVVVDFTINEPGDIFFTYTDGIPDIPYQVGDMILLTKTNTLRVMATDKNGNTSKISSYKYIVDFTPPIVSASPPPQPYGEPIDIVLSVNEEDAMIYYTTDGSDPTGQSAVYTTPIRLESGKLTLKARGVDAAGNRSEIETFEYEVVETPAGGSFGDPVVVTADLGQVTTAFTFGKVDDVIFRYDKFIPEATYEVEFVEVPEEQGGGSGVVVFDDTQANISSGWIMMPLRFTATTASMYIMAARGTNHWDPVKLVIRQVQ